jgi:hypothetical protein
MYGNTAITANYSLTAVAVSPNPATVTIGGTVGFTATVNGTLSTAVTWTVAAPSGSSLSPGTITTTGFYTTPYPAPPTVTVTATSTADATLSGSATVTISPLAAAAGPALSVDAGSQTHAISPYIYGMNAYLLANTPTDADNAAAVAPANITIDRWGGNASSEYNYQLDVTNAASDWYFENMGGTDGDGWVAVNGVSAFDALAASNNANRVKTIGTVPVLGWVAKDSTSCSFPQSVYSDQLAVNGLPAFSSDGRACGSGVYPNGVGGCTNINGCNIPGDPTVTSIAAGPAWAGQWVSYLAGKFGTAANGGVAVYDLDAEPSWWDVVHRDVHPAPFTYDEVTNNGMATALAIKTADPTAEVSGPVIDWWWDYFYSKKDVESGLSAGDPCYAPWSNPIDREAHNGTPFIEYYLKQFATYDAANHLRLLDYVDLHGYYATDYHGINIDGTGVGMTTAGDTGEQQARINSTRAFWDPSYTDPNYPQPNYITDANYTTSCSTPLQAPQVIRMMKSWVANDYPGTKTAIDEYNFGGMEAINGALTQADILGIFGREGLDLGVLWPTTNPSQQIPGMMAFAIYRNYDGKKSMFGDTALLSTSINQGQLSVYGALRSSDNAVTVVVINKTYGDLTSTLSLFGLFPPATSAQAYVYSNANLNAIVGPTSVTVTPSSGTVPWEIANYTFPAQSITLFVVQQ